LLFPVAGITEIDTPKLINAYVLPKRLCQSEANELELSRCLDAANRSAESHLSRIQVEITKHLDASKKQAFTKVSKSWKDFSKVSCQFDATGAEGNSVGSIYAGCMFDYTVLRIRQLEKYAYCLSGRDCQEPHLLHLIISPVKY